MDEGGVAFDGLLGGAGASGGDVAGEGEGAAAEVHGLHGFARRGGEVDDMADAALVLEVQIRRVVEVHVRLWGAVDEQRPGPRTVPVGHQLGEPAVDFGDDGLRRPPVA